MLYIEDDRRDLWPTVARILSSLMPLDMVLCLYVGDGAESFSSPFQSPEVDEYLETVTRSENDEQPPCSTRVPVDESFLTWLEPRTDELEEWGHSLSLYRPGKYELVAAAIPHEGMILVADEFGSPLAASGLRLSEDPPEWW